MQEHPRTESVEPIDLTLGRLRLALEKWNQDRCHDVIDDHFRTYKQTRKRERNMPLADMGLPLMLVNRLEESGIIMTDDLDEWSPDRVIAEVYRTNETGVKAVMAALAKFKIRVKGWTT